MHVRILVTTALLTAPLIPAKPGVMSDGTISPQLRSYTRSPAAKTRIKTAVSQFALWVDESKWKGCESETWKEPDALCFSHVNDEDTVALVVPLPVGLPTTALPSVWLQGMKEVDSNASIGMQEMRIVNGRQVIVAQLSLKGEGVPYKALAYFYGGATASVIIFGATPENQFPAHLGDITELLNGLEITDSDRPFSASREVEPTPGLLSLMPNISLKYDPKRWKQSDSDESNSYALNHSSGAAWAIVTTDPVPLPLDILPDVVLAGFRTDDPNAAIVFKEKRRVNGTEVWFMKIEGQSRNIPMTFAGYVYSSKAGVVEVMTFSRKAAFAEYEKDLMEFLDGLRIAE